MTAKPTAEKIAGILQGTPMSLTAALANYDAEELENDAKFCHELDALVFCCTRCDWWHEQSEMSESEDWVCTECADNDGD